MHITGIHYHFSQNIGLKDNIFKLHLYKVYLIQPCWYTKIILSPIQILITPCSYSSSIKYSNWII